MRISQEKAVKIKSGQTLYRVWMNVGTNRFVTPHEERIDISVEELRPLGKRKHHKFSFEDCFMGVLCHNLSGTWGGYFTKRKQAERFKQEIENGLHPQLVAAARQRDLEFDLLDEEMGVCDRGLGSYEDDRDDRAFLDEVMSMETW